MSRHIGRNKDPRPVSAGILRFSIKFSTASGAPPSYGLNFPNNHIPSVKTRLNKIQVTMGK